MATKRRKVNQFMARINANGSEIKAQRAEMLMRDAQNAQNRIVLELQDRLNKTDIEIDRLCDIGPTDSTSLLATDKDFNAEKWAKELQRLSVDKEQIIFELDIATENFKKFFGELPEAEEGK